jgi:hypothetical protein
MILPRRPKTTAIIRGIRAEFINRETKALPVPQFTGSEMYGISIHGAGVAVNAFESHQFSAAAILAG